MKMIMPWMAAMAALAIGSTAQGEEGMIVHLDPIRILEASEQSDPASAQFREERERKQKEFEAKRDAIREMREQFDARAVMLSDEERKKQKTEVTKKATDLIGARAKEQEALKVREKFLAMVLIDRVRSVIEELGEANGYRYILEGGQQPVLFADDSLDITEVVLKKLAENH